MKTSLSSTYSMSFIIFIFITVNSLRLESQTFINDGANISIRKDSVFEFFLPPIVHKDLLNSVGEFRDFQAISFDVICIVNVDSYQKVKDIKLFPLYGYGNTLADSSIYWKSLLRSIDSVSKFWVFKPLLHKIKDEYPQNLIEYYQDINQKVLSGQFTNGRPFYGKQSHIIYLSIALPWIEVGEPNFIYYLKVDQ